MSVPKFVDARVAVGEDLNLPEFACLYPDAELYSVAVLQPNGRIEAGHDYVRTSDRDTTYNKHWQFLKLASRKHVHLALTPEYSCPWKVLERCLQEDILPAEDALWVLGCEGISLSEFAAVKERTRDVAWRGGAVVAGGDGFIDPVCYVFQAQKPDGAKKLVVLVQCKTTSMPDKWLHFERDHMIRGREIYVFNMDRGDRIRLVTLICSDCHEFATTGICDDEIYSSYLILHSQLCFAPFHAVFKRYREHDFLLNRMRREFMTFNWAAGFEVPEQPPSKYGASALYTQSDDVTRSDDRINDLHASGVYYGHNSREQRVHIYCLNYSERVVVLRTTKASQDLATALLQGNRRTGPQDASSYTWSNQTWVPNSPVDDGLSLLCAAAGANAAPLSAMSPLDRERFLSLTTASVRGVRGEIRLPEDLGSMQIDNDERMQRIAVDLDPRIRAEAEKKLRLFETLRSGILPHPANFPENIAKMQDSCELEYPIDGTDFECNLSSENAKPASVAYIGEGSDHLAQRMADRIATAIAKPRWPRVVVWYLANGQCYSYSIPSENISQPVKLSNAIV